MLSPNHRRRLSLALVATLCLSSVGLPVIVMVCGIGKCVVTSRPANCSPAELTTEQITSPPCQARMFFVERNTTAYLPVKSAVEFPLLDILLVIPAGLFPTTRISSLHSGITESPPVIHDDIPIFISSLLI